MSNKGPRRIDEFFETWRMVDIDEDESEQEVLGSGLYETHIMEPDEFDIEDDVTASDKAEELITDEGASEPSSIPWTPGTWYTRHSEMDPRSGEYEDHSFHLKGFTKTEEKEIYSRTMGLSANPLTLPDPEPIPSGVYDDEWYSRPIEPEKWGVFGFDVTAPGRGELQILLPEDADKKLIEKLDNSFIHHPNDLVVATQTKRTYLLHTASARRRKLDLAAKIIRGWHEETGWAGKW